MSRACATSNICQGPTTFPHRKNFRSFGAGSSSRMMSGGDRKNFSQHGLQETAMDVRFVDTTFRDGSQSMWASGMRTGMMEAVAEIMDEVGFAAIEVPVNGIYFKKIVSDLKEDPWDLLRMLGRKMP